MTSFLFKVGLSPSKKKFVICLIEDPLEVMKNAFCSQDIQDKNHTIYANHILDNKLKNTKYGIDLDFKFNDALKQIHIQLSCYITLLYY